MNVHWWMAASYPALIATGIAIAHLPDDFPGLAALRDFHESVAMGTLVLLVWRIIALVQVLAERYSRRFPRLTRHWWQKTLNHAALYVMMLGVPLTGLLLSNSLAAHDVTFFGWPVPDLFPPDPDRVPSAYSLHFWSSYGLLLAAVYQVYEQRHYARAMLRRFRLQFDRHPSA